MKHALFIFALFVLSIGCHKEDTGAALKEFHDDFESYSTYEDLIGTGDHQWTEFNINEFNLSANPITIDSQIVHSGLRSVRFDCTQNDPGFVQVAKCNLNKGGFFFKHGETFHFSAWYYLRRAAPDYGTFFILDLGEIVGGSSEIRIMAWEENLELERNKLGLPNLFQEQPAKLFPVNQWAHIELEVKLSQYRYGAVKMWLDGEEIINKDKIITMPRDRANLVWGTKGYYERIQVGITAKSGTQDLVMYVDDVDVWCE
ncbi:MAG TPA: heparin lyase I family protein [Bacteroidia bacterium]|nr:heparin lyase I family protein [Bacteroidia bacterium]